MKSLVTLLFFGLILSCSNQKGSVDSLRAENDSLRNLLLVYQQKELQEKQNAKEAFEKEKKSSEGIILNGQIKVVKTASGFNPYNSDNLWLPEITIMFKNISGSNIKDLIQVKGIFINNSTGEQISEATDFLCSSSGPFIKGTQKQISLKSSVGWTAGVNHNVSVIIYIEDEEFKTIKIKNREFTGRI